VARTVGSKVASLGVDLPCIEEHLDFDVLRDPAMLLVKACKRLELG